MTCMCHFACMMHGAGRFALPCWPAWPPSWTSVAATTLASPVRCVQGALRPPAPMNRSGRSRPPHSLPILPPCDRTPSPPCRRPACSCPPHRSLPSSTSLSSSTPSVMRASLMMCSSTTWAASSPQSQVWHVHLWWVLTSAPQRWRHSSCVRGNCPWPRRAVHTFWVCPAGVPCDSVVNLEGPTTVGIQTDTEFDCSNLAQL